jgi:hypothetical protein
MAFNIEAFRALGLPGGGARPALFEVRIPVPPQGVSGNFLKDMVFQVRSAELPASVIQPVEIPYFGRKVKVAGDRVFQDWQITVMNDEDFGLRNFFEAWHNKINSLVSNRQDSAQDDLLDYKVNAEVLQYGKAGPGDDSGIIRAYSFAGMFPIQIDAIALDWERTNEVEMFNVTFSYDYWTPSIFSNGLNAESYSPTTAPDPTISNGA